MMATIDDNNVSDWTPSDSILKYIKDTEAFRKNIYKDGNGKETIGYGFTDKKLLDKYRKKSISKKEADRIFEDELVPEFTKYLVNNTENFDELTDDQRDALFSYIYNIGVGSYKNKNPQLHKALSDMDLQEVAQNIDFGYFDENNSGLKKRRNYERELFGYKSDKDGNVYPIKSDEEDDSPLASARDIEGKFGDTGYVGAGYDGKKVRVSKNMAKSVGISKDADPDKWYESVNPALNTDFISLAADFIPTLGRMMDSNRERSGYDTATDFEEKMWKAYTNGDVSFLPKSNYRFDDDDDNAQYVGLPNEQAIIIQSLLDKKYIDKMLDKAYEDADDDKKKQIDLYRAAYNKLNESIFSNPGKWVLVNEEMSPFREAVFGDNYEKLYQTSGLGALKNFSVRWDPKSKMLDVKDDYDFNGKKIAEHLIPDRDVPLRIRERIKYSPNRGSVMRNKPKTLNEKRFERKFEEGGEVSKEETSAKYTYTATEEPPLNRDAIGLFLAATGDIPVVGGLSRDDLRDRRRIIPILTPEGEASHRSLPSYANPNSSIGASWVYNKKRLLSGAYEMLTGEKLEDGGKPYTTIRKWNDPEVFDDAKRFLGDDYSDDEVNEIIGEIYGYGLLNGNVIKSEGVDDSIDIFIKNNHGLTNKDVADFIRDRIDGSGEEFVDGKIVSKNIFQNKAEVGTKIKNYFGLTDDAQEVTPEMLEYAARNYVKDYGFDNEMTDYFKSIVDYKKAAKWITDHTSVGLGAYYVGDKVANPNKKRFGGKKPSIYQLGFAPFWYRDGYGDPKDISHRIMSKKFMYFFGGDDDYDELYDDDTPSWIKQKIKLSGNRGDRRAATSTAMTFEDGGDVKRKQKQAYDYFTNKRGMSKIQALAILGNLMAESELDDSVYGDNNSSYGIQQWHNERMDNLFRHARKKGHSEPTFEDQLEFLADEYEGKTGYSNFLYTRRGQDGPGYYNYSKMDFQNAENLHDAVVAWNQGAGRPHKSVIRNEDRYNEALAVARNLGLEIEDEGAQLYGQMGFGKDVESQPEVQPVASPENAGQEVTEVPEEQEQSYDERFKSWAETYGKDIMSHLLSLQEENEVLKRESEMKYKQYQKDLEEDKKRALIAAVLPNIQLNIKGMAKG